MHANEELNEIDDENGDLELSVYISHGNNSLWKEVETYIQKELDLPTMVLSEIEDPGQFPIERIDDETNDCFFGIVVMAADDAQSSFFPRSRENVLHEIGFLQGKFGIENVLVIKPDTVEEFKNIPGIAYESYTGNNIKSAFARVMQELDLAIDAAEDAYHEEND